MKKVILNAPILGLNGETIVSPTGRVFTGENGVQSQEQKPLTFAQTALNTIIRSRTRSDEEAAQLFALAEKLNNTLKASAPEILELSDEDFTVVKEAIDREAVIVKARFLQMVEDLNAE